jgi:ketosteroid isomerase-like protein
MDAPAFAKSWMDAFNAGDVERIMAHYSEDVEHSSPTVVRLLGEPSGTVRGKSELRAYFEKALAAAGPGLRFDVQRLYVGAPNGLTLCYHRSGGRLVAETFHLDERGLVTRAFVAHADP